LKNNTVLTPREMEVMHLVKEGLPNKTIADQLSISAETVKKHLKNIYEKLGVNNKIEALNKLNSKLLH
jgi:DNA-binding CsgD family transcriptional regulator